MVLLSTELVDYVVLGDGEQPLYHLLQSFSHTAALVPGLLSRIYLHQPQLSTLHNLDELLPPDFDDLPIQAYFMHQPEKMRELPVFRSKGCIFNCPFCSRKLYDNSYRAKTALSFGNELQYLANKYNTIAFYFVDSLINPTARSLEDLVVGLQYFETIHRWRANASLSRFLSAVLLKRLQEVGCYRLSYGLETGSPSVRLSMKKLGRIDIVERIIRDTHAAGIIVSIWLMVGFPTEGEHEFCETIDFMKRNADYIDTVQISICSIIPGTDLANFPTRFGIRKLGFGQS